MNDYSDANPPKRGTGRAIYKAMKAAGLGVSDLHYNPNCWGNKVLGLGWGTWACTVIRDDLGVLECFCGVVEGRVYLQQNCGPYNHWFL